MRRFALVLAAAAGLLVGSASPLAADGAPSIAPDIEGGDGVGLEQGAAVAPLDLAALEGQVVVVEFITTWCGACRRATPSLNRFQSAYRDGGLVVVATSYESVAKLEQFRESNGFTLTLAHDDGRQAGRAHEVDRYPTFLVIDRAGEVRGRFVGAGRNLSRVETLFKKLLTEGGRNVPGDQGGMHL